MVANDGGREIEAREAEEVRTSKLQQEERKMHAYLRDYIFG